MQVEIALVGDVEQADQVGRIGLEGLRAIDRESAAVDVEAGLRERLATRRTAGQETREPLRRRLQVLGFQLGGENAGQCADLAGDQEVAAHEALHAGSLVARADPVGIAHAPGQLRLQVEADPFFRPAGGEVQVRAHRFQEVEGANERAHFAALEHVQFQQLVEAVGRVQVAGDPEQGVQVPEAALALLDVGLDHEAAGAGPGVALVALAQLGGDELGASALHHLVAEALGQLRRQRFVAGKAAGLQDRGADGDVFTREPHAFVDGARGVADFESQVP